MLSMLSWAIPYVYFTIEASLTISIRTSLATNRSIFAFTICLATFQSSMKLLIAILPFKNIERCCIMLGNRGCLVFSIACKQIAES